MPLPRLSLTTSQLVSRWKQRQQEIIETLPPDLLAEYRKLDELIRAVYAEEAKRARETAEQGDQAKVASSYITGSFYTSPVRAPLAVHKKNLVEFLASHGPATRGDIRRHTGVPLGSLSKLLSEKEFEQKGDGLWGLYRQGKKPGTSAPPGK